MQVLFSLSIVLSSSRDFQTQLSELAKAQAVSTIITIIIMIITMYVPSYCQALPSDPAAEH